MPLSAETYLWEHWKFNADQRLKAFNFYVVFAMVDARSRHLLHVTKEGLMHFEQSLPLACRPFQLDDMHRQRWLRYTVAFNLLFGMQLLFGVMLVAYGLVRW